MQNDPFSPLELYSLKADPQEKTNLAATNKKVVNELSAALRQHIQRAAGHRGSRHFQNRTTPRNSESSAMKHLLILTLLVLVGSLAPAANRPNIVVCIADDVSWDDYGCYGSRTARTPRIDALAAGGLRFTQAYLTASSCSPSRSSIITGRYPHNLGRAAELHQPIAAHLPWFPAPLRRAGYYTALVGKNHMTTDSPEAVPPGLSSPWDFVDPGITPDNHGAESKWVQTIESRPKDKPFFFWFASLDAHRDWDADKEWIESKYGPQHRPQDLTLPPFLADEPATRRDLASYHNEVTRFDYFVGQVADALAAQGQIENTLLFVLADNGRPFPRAKTRLHDSGMKTALIAHWPAGIRGRGVTSASLVSVIDFAPTFLELADVAAPPSFQGVSLNPLFRDPQAVIRRHAFSEHNWHDYEAHGRSVRSEGYLYIRNARPALPWQGPADSVRSPSHQALRALREAQKLTPAQADVFLVPRPPEELYFTAHDSNQINNLIADSAHANARERLAALLDQWIADTGDAAPEKLTPDSFDRHTGKSLGNKSVARGEHPGSPKSADKINAPGPR
jgi:arylsulfatase A-like enzyme